MSPPLPRRRFMQLTAAAATALTGLAGAAQSAPQADDRKRRTRFQLACMTLPYSRFPLQRALQGIRKAGYSFVAWGTTHTEEGGKQAAVMPADAPPARAKELAARCRDLGLEPIMMFSNIYPEAKNGLEVLRARVHQAAAAKIPQLLTFGHTKGGNHKLWV